MKLEMGYWKPSVFGEGMEVTLMKEQKKEALTSRESTTIQPSRGHRREKMRVWPDFLTAAPSVPGMEQVPSRGLSDERVSEDVASGWAGAVLTVLGQRLPRLGSVNPHGKLGCGLAMPCARNANGAQRAQPLHLLCFRGHGLCVWWHWTQRRGMGMRAGIWMGLWCTELRAWPGSRFWVLSHFLKEKT